VIQAHVIEEQKLTASLQTEEKVVVLPTVIDNIYPMQLAKKFKLAVDYAYTTYPKLKWVVRCDDTSYIRPKSMSQFLGNVRNFAGVKMVEFGLGEQQVHFNMTPQERHKLLELKKISGPKGVVDKGARRKLMAASGGGIPVVSEEQGGGVEMIKPRPLLIGMFRQRSYQPGSSSIDAGNDSGNNDAGNNEGSEQNGADEADPSAGSGDPEDADSNPDRPPLPAKKKHDHKRPPPPPPSNAEEAGDEDKKRRLDEDEGRQLKEEDKKKKEEEKKPEPQPPAVNSDYFVHPKTLKLTHKMFGGVSPYRKVVKKQNKDWFVPELEYNAPIQQNLTSIWWLCFELGMTSM